MAVLAIYKIVAYCSQQKFQLKAVSYSLGNVNGN